MTVIYLRNVYRPDPRNGEVYACESFQCTYDGPQEIQSPNGFIVVHTSCSGDNAAVLGKFETLELAQAAAVTEAQRRQAVLA